MYQVVEANKAHAPDAQSDSDSDEEEEGEQEMEEFADKTTNPGKALVSAAPSSSSSDDDDEEDDSEDEEEATNQPTLTNAAEAEPESDVEASEESESGEEEEQSEGDAEEEWRPSNEDSSKAMEDNNAEAAPEAQKRKTSQVKIPSFSEAPELHGLFVCGGCAIISTQIIMQLCTVCTLPQSLCIHKLTKALC